MTSLILNINERDGTDGYHFCKDCGSKTMLISALEHWVVDQEAFKDGERTDDDEGIPQDVQVAAEVTAHWCDTCNMLTSLAFHQN